MRDQLGLRRRTAVRPHAEHLAAERLRELPPRPSRPPASAAVRVQDAALFRKERE